MPSYYYTKFQKNPCVGRNERCPLKSTTDPVPILCMLQTQYESSVYSAVHYRHSTSPLYTLQAPTDPDTVLAIIYSLLHTQYQSSVYSAVQYRPSISPPYNPRSTTEPVSLLRIKYSPIQTQYLSIVYPAV